MKKFEEYYSRHLTDETYLYEGIEGVLEELNNKEVINIVLTNKP